MKQGKVSEVVLKRSVFKNISSKNERVLWGAEIAGDCGIVCVDKDNMAIVTSGVADYAGEDREYYTFYKAFNNLFAKGAKPLAMILNIIMPENAKEKQLKEIVKRYDILCRKHNMEICGGHTQFTNKVNEIISSITMIGEQNYDFRGIMKDRRKDEQKADDREMHIVMTKAIGIEGTAIIAKDRESVLRERFNGRFCNQCLEFKNYISIEKESVVAASNNALFMHDVSGSGVFGAIWELASAFNMGAEIDLRNIPVWQETIEVTELFDINPYKMVSQGSLLIVTYDGKDMVEKLEEQNIPASVIGKLVEGNDKVLFNGDEKRFLEPPRGDEIYKMI